MNIKRWLLCAFLFLICYFVLRWLNNKNIVEGDTLDRPIHPHL